jgi:ribosomal protein RSM22 (predicted rRNA methylase)
MILPVHIQQKVNELYAGLNKEKLVSKREQLTMKYKTSQAVNKSVFESSEDSAVYAISRMPSTFAVVYTLVNDLLKQNKIEDVNSIIDIGSGTGAGYFACRELFEDVDISLFERDKNMIDIFDKFETGEEVKRFDFLKDSIDKTADLVMSNYVFSELNEEGRKTALKKMLDCSNKYVLVVDTGTPRTYENFMKLKKMVSEMGYKVIAPCSSEKCGLKNDYCQFFARVERSSLLKMSKAGELSYEDEKYFYLLIAKNVDLKEINDRRVIRRPQIKTNFVELKLCTNSGVFDEKFTKKDKISYQKARKIKINELM